MKLFSLSCTFISLASQVAAFPALSPEVFDKRQTSRPQGQGALPLTPPPFDAASQYVSTTGAHAFIAPGPGDARGECPGLNAAANHGYLPRNGRPTISQFITGTYQVFGMAQDLSTFLAVYGAILDGDGTGWSIGGVPHTGILGSHSNYETDSGPVKSDLNQYGSNTMSVMSQFMDLYNRQPYGPTANYNLDILREFRGKRFNQSVSGNPYFFYGPFNGVQVSQAAFTFIYRFMSNKSAQYPEGTLNKAVLKSFFSVQGPEDNLYWVPGNERIPDNWYKRNDADQYSIPYFQADLLYVAEAVPLALTVGCNAGKVNTYTPMDPAVLTGGAYTAQSVAANPLCFSAAFLEAGAAAVLGLSATKSAALVKALNKATGSNCAAITNPNFAMLKACPGFSQYGGPTAPIAPGAIQY